MGPIGHQRIAQRFRVTTTPITWTVPKRKKLDARSKSFETEAAIIELSVMGAAIVCPLKWRAVAGTKVEVAWEGHRGRVLVRREAPMPGSSNLALYGVEFTDTPSEIGQALFECLVMAPAARRDASAAAAAAEAVIGGFEPAPSASGPALWAAPVSWDPNSR